MVTEELTREMPRFLPPVTHLFEVMMSAAAKHVECSHCVEGPETFWYMARKYLFDVDLARVLVNDGRESMELDDESVQHAVETSVINEGHLAHVKTQYPGIIAHIWYPADNGEMIHGHVLIDGHHRAARCLQLELPFFVCLLSEEESREILLRSPAQPELQPLTA